MYIYIYIYICTHSIYLCMFYLFMYMYVCVYVSIYLSLSIYLYTYIYIYIYMSLNTILTKGCSGKAWRAASRKQPRQASSVQVFADKPWIYRRFRADKPRMPGGWASPPLPLTAEEEHASAAMTRRRYT